ncbi:universal stress protein [Streptomyces sp. NBC_01618]|uniref:universal stress protein n=1 Tax=Streptomyces sp. NBC_01618 TaxID=2975900 RepID=UPI0038708705|nr:universal stress protein [Streptomyces sp. NBC_01618]
MKLPLVSGVDGSESSLRAVDWAADEAALHGLSLRLVYASRWEQYEGAALALALGRPSERALADRIAEVTAERVRRRHPEVDVSADVTPEDAVIALLHEGRNAEALITGERGRGGLTGLLLGSVSLAVAARAPCPVIVVRGDRAGIEGGHGRILLGVGEPEGGSAAVRFAFREAGARGCELDAVRAWRCPSHDRADHPRTVDEPHLYWKERAATLIDEAVAETVREHPTVRLHSAAVEGTAAKVLVRRSAAADLIVVGAHRRRGYLGLQLGRVAHALLHHADCPVAVVPLAA